MSANNELGGGDALIHLRVSLAVKARWVRDSRLAGKKLTDWITDRVERKTMNIFKVPASLAHKYHGAGYGLVATVNGQLMDIIYLEDVLTDFSGERADVVAAINDARLGPTVRHLQALGSVHMGMLSSWEFIEL